MDFIVDQKTFDNTKTLLVIDLFRLGLKDEFNHFFEKIGSKHDRKCLCKDGVKALNGITRDNIAISDCCDIADREVN